MVGGHRDVPREGWRSWPALKSITANSPTIASTADPMEFSGEADVIIDFSNASSLETLLAYCVRRHIP